MTNHENDTLILKAHIQDLVNSLEKGNSANVSGGYITHNYKDSLIQRHCSKIVAKLVSLGYEYTTNHGHGCRDYRFTKSIDL